MKVIRTTMPDGSDWDVPASLVANHRAEYYAQKETGQNHGAKYVEEFNREYDYAMSDPCELFDWCRNNINWSDIKVHATKASESECDYEDGWSNGDKEIVEI